MPNPPSGLTPSRSSRRLTQRSPTHRHMRTFKFEQRHGIDEAAQIKAQVKAFADFLKNRDRNKRLVMRPTGKNKFLNLWDLITSLALLYTATVTPFEASFLEGAMGPKAWGDGWFLVNRALDFIFCVDMVLQFFLAYQVCATRPCCCCTRLASLTDEPSRFSPPHAGR